MIIDIFLIFVQTVILGSLVVGCSLVIISGIREQFLQVQDKIYRIVDDKLPEYDIYGELMKEEQFRKELQDNVVHVKKFIDSRNNVGI